MFYHLHKYNLKEKFIYDIVHRVSDNNSYIGEVIRKVIVVIVTNTDASENIYNYVNMFNERCSSVFVQILDKKSIAGWAEKYPIDYNNAISFYDKKIVDDSNDVVIDKNDFEAKSQANIAVLKQEIEHNENFAIVLGAGVSIDLGAKSWDDLLLHFEKELKSARIIDNVDKLCEKVGGSSLITAQLCKDLYKNNNDYYWAIHTGLYGVTLKKAIYEIDEIVSIIRENIHKKQFRVLTYNFDNYLEQHLSASGVDYNVLFDGTGTINEKLSIYHVHGFLPKVSYKKYMEQNHMKSIYLTEENYNELYNQPYSWQISSQLSFFRENVCMFVGCSLSDPNIRRLLELTRTKHRKHFAILVKDGMNSKDLTIASKHFARLGVEIIWVEDFDDITRVLSQLH